MDVDQMSIGSIISLRSLADDNAILSPRKQNGKATPKTKKGTPYVTSKARKKRTGREVWLNAVQNGGGVSAENSAMKSLKAMHEPRSSTSLYLQEAFGIKQSKIRPSSVTARVGGKGQVYKDAETYYDEIQILKKSLKDLKHDYGQLKAKNQRLSDEVNMKSKKIEELLSPHTQNNDLRRTLTSKNPNSNEVVMSLRRKIHRLEESLRNKENEVRDITSNIKYTNMEELKMENETLFYEINRMRVQMEERPMFSENMIHDAIQSSASGDKAEIMIKRLTEDNRSLVEQNKSLKCDLMKYTTQKPSKNQASKDYEDMSQADLLQKIHELEQKLKEEEKRDILSEGKQTPRKKKTEVEVEDERCIVLKGPLPQQVKQLREREKGLLEEVDKLHTAATKLKEDRSHYRKMTDDYRQQLEDFEKIQNTLPPVQVKSEAENQVKQTLKKKSSVMKTRRGPSKEELKNFEEKRAARTIQRGWRNRKEIEKETKDERKTKQESEDEEDEYEDAIVNIQAAMRAHKSRDKYVTSQQHQAKAEQARQAEDESVLLIQSTFRGHATREKFIREAKKREELREKKARNESSALRESLRGDHRMEADNSTDEDDAVVVGSSVSLSHYRDNQQPKQYPEQKTGLRDQNNRNDREQNNRHQIEYRDTHQEQKDQNKREQKGFRDQSKDHKSDRFGNQSREDEYKPPRRDPFTGKVIDDQKKSTKNRGTIDSFIDDEDTSVNQLQSSSSPWSHTPQQFLSEDNENSDDDAVVCATTPVRKKDKTKPKKEQKDNGKSKEKLKNKWEKSGSKSEVAEESNKAFTLKERLAANKTLFDDELF